MVKTHNICSIASRRHSNRHGIMLIIVMWISFGLVSIALLFCDSMMLEYRASDNTIAGLQSTSAVEGALRYLCFILENQDESGYMPDKKSYTSEEISIGNTLLWIIGNDYNDTASSDQKPVFGIMDECSKINLNTASLEMLEGLPNMTSEFAAAIIDWRDADTELTPNGAESDYYALRDPSYYCKDSAFETVEELRLVQGCTWDILYGEDSNRNGILDPNENDGDVSYPADNSDGKLTKGLLDYVTVYSREPNTRDDGSGRINIKNNQEGLTQLLQNTLGQQRAEQIMQLIGRNPGSINSALEFYLRSAMTAQEFSLIADAISVTDGAYIPGLINVNTASKEVLACIPGIGDEFAQKLVDIRQNKTADELKSITWVTEALDNEHATQAGPFITTRTCQFSLDIAAVNKLGTGYRRDLFVIDMSSGESVVVYRRALTRLGWALGSEIRETYDLQIEQ